MKRYLLLFVPVLIAATLFNACKKDDEGQRNTVTPGAYRSLEEAVNSTAPVAKSTAMSVSSGGILVAPGGTTIIFPPNAFETLSGGKVTGSVNVTVNDWLHKGDMVFGRVLPITYYKTDPPAQGETFDKPLASAGEAFIQVTQNNQVLRVRKDQHVMVLFPQQPGGPLLSTPIGWVGRTMIGSGNTVNWLAVDTNVLLPIQYADTIALRADTLHYVQAAEQLGISGFSNFTIKLNSSVTLEKSMAVALYDGYKAIFPLPGANGGEIRVSGVPAMPMHIAVMGINQGNFYGGVVSVPSPASDSTYSVIIKAQEPATLRLHLNSL